MKRLAFIGTGGMGGPMAANLIKAGHKLTVLDIRREMTRTLEKEGAAYVPSPRAAAEASEVVLSMLPFGDAVREVGLGKGGLVEAASGARIWIDFSSVEQQSIIEVEKGLKPNGWTVIDATVVGVEEYAVSGELSIRVAGDKDAVEKIRPLLMPMGKKITYCGMLGNAKLVKIATAMHSAVQTMATVEIFNWLESCGVSEEVTYEAFKDSQSWSIAVHHNCEAILSKKFKPRKSWMPKDIGFGLDNAQEKGVPLPFTALARQLFNVARSNRMDGYEAIGIAYKVYGMLGMGEKK